jgi:PAS domain S-box-containing protein
MQLQSDGGLEGQQLATRAAQLAVGGSGSNNHEVVQLEAALATCVACFDVSVGSLIDPFVLLRPVREPDGVIVDFVYEYANLAACDANGLVPEELVGTFMLGRVTQLAPLGLFDAYVQVIETNCALSLDAFAQPTRRGAEPDQRYFDLRALRTGDVLVLTWRDMTERDRVDAEHVRLATIIGWSADAIMSLDADLRIVTWNRGAEEVYGYAADEILGRSSDVLIPGDATLESRGLRQHTVAGGKVHRYQTQRLHKDGGMIDVEITAFIQVDAAGADAGVTTITRDVSEQTHAAHELAASEGRYREILDATPDGVWRLDAREQTDYVNRRMADMLGYTPEEMLGRKLSNFMAADAQQVAREELEAARSEGRTGLVENCFLRKDGTECWARVSHRPLTNQRGEDSGSLAIVSDISAQKIQTIEMREAERFLAALTDGMAEGVCAINSDGEMTYMNHAAEKLLGWSHQDLAGRSLHETIHYQHDDGSPYPAGDCPLVGVLATGTVTRVEDDTFTRHDGRLLPVAYSAAPITTGDEVSGVVVVFGDVSARRAAEQRHDRERETMNWVGRVRDALDEDRLVLHAQPIIDLRTRTVVMHELLLRMIDRDGTMIAPDRFLPAAEQYGLIEDIDRWVLNQALALAATGNKVHFNISGNSLGSRQIIGDLDSGLRRTGADPALLVCEITETALSHDEALAEAFVYALSERGCEIALDDFGIGYSGFTYLKRLPVTVLKIDIQFVHDLSENPQNQHVVKAIVNLAQGFKRGTVAEGVEDLASLELLDQYGVDYAQGYAIGRPQPLELAFSDERRNERGALS